MGSKRNAAIVGIAVVLSVLGAAAVLAQDKYTLKIPDGLAFSEFRDTRPGRLSLSVIPRRMRR